MNSAHNAMGTLLRSKWCSPTQCQSYAKKNPFTFKTMRKCSCSSCPVPKTVSKQKLEIQLLVSNLLSFWSCCRWCSLSWFLTYFAHTSALSCTRLVCLPVGLNGSIYPMTSFTDWTVFREGTPADCTIFLFSLFFWVKASSCALKFWQCCSAHGSQRESRFRCRDHDVCQQSKTNLKVGSASHF